MSRFQELKEAFRRRLLSAAAEQLLARFQRTISGYEAELSRSRRLLELLSDRDQLRAAGLPPDVLWVRTEQQGWSFSHRAEAAGGGSEAHSCSVCGRTFSRQLDFKYHVLMHTELKPFKCGVCKRRFRWPGRVRAHRCSRKRTRGSKISRRTRPEDGGVRRTYRGGTSSCDAPPRTPWTGATYRRKKVMQSDGGHGFHGNTGTGGRRHGDQDTAQNPPLRSEPGLHTEEPPGCQKQNQKQKQNQRATASLSCSVCAAAFCNRDSLVLHMRSHARPARFTCPVCARDFVWRRHLTKHMELHQEQSGGDAPCRQDESDDGDTDDSDFWAESRDAPSRRRFGCPECEETFRSRSLLKLHAAAHREQRSQQGEVKEEPEEAQISTSVHPLPVKTEEEEEEEEEPACLQPESSDSVDSDFWKDDRKRPSVTS